MQHIHVAMMVFHYAITFSLVWVSLYVTAIPWNRKDCFGCIFEVSTNDKWVQRAAEFVIQVLGPEHELLRVEDVQLQLIHGLKYTLSLLIEKDGYPYSCTAVVYQTSDDTKVYLENLSNC